MENPCSIFVGSLAIETSKDTLQEYFGRFGPIESAVVLGDPNTGRSRGFGFVNFSSREARDSALSSGPHFVDNKQVECKVAVRKGDMKADMGGAGGGRGRSEQISESQEKKVFLGGISNGTTNEEIESSLSRFGTVIGVEIKVDKVTQRMRGFGFVEFSSPGEATKAVASQFVQINGKTVEIKLAQNRQAVPYGTPGGFASTFTNSMGIYGQPMAYSSYNAYPSNTTGFSSGAASYNPGYASSQGYGSNNQFQSYGSKETSSPYGTAYSSGFSGNASSTYGGGGGSTASNFGGGSGYGRGAYNPYNQ